MRQRTPHRASLGRPTTRCVFLSADTSARPGGELLQAVWTNVAAPSPRDHRCGDGGAAVAQSGAKWCSGDNGDAGVTQRWHRVAYIEESKCFHRVCACLRVQPHPGLDPLASARSRWKKPRFRWITVLLIGSTTSSSTRKRHTTWRLKMRKTDICPTVGVSREIGGNVTL